MKHFLFFFGFLFFATSQPCIGQYSISGYLDTPEKNKRVYLSLLRYNEDSTIYLDQILTSTLTDSLGYFSFEGQLLSKKHALYRIHSRVDEEGGAMQMSYNEDLKNLHNFVFSNQDTIFFERNNKYWFSSYSNTNPIDKEWQDFGSYVNQLNKELYSVKDFRQKKKSSTQLLSELKFYANSKEVHPLVTLVLLSGVEEGVLKEDFKDDTQFYMKLKDSLNGYYNNSDYAEQFNELIIDLSKTETQLELVLYKRLTYILGTLGLILLIGIIFLLFKLKQKKLQYSSQGIINLTKQEERVAQLINQDKTNKEIASKLYVSLSTVKTHIRNIYAKMEVSNRREFRDKLKDHFLD
jgi:DNA-binding CsgD family transcriptional regulator